MNIPNVPFAWALEAVDAPCYGGGLRAAEAIPGDADGLSGSR